MNFFQAFLLVLGVCRVYTQALATEDGSPSFHLTRRQAVRSLLSPRDTPGSSSGARPSLELPLPVTGELRIKDFEVHKIRTNANPGYWVQFTLTDTRSLEFRPRQPPRIESRMQSVPIYNVVTRPDQEKDVGDTLTNRNYEFRLRVSARGKDRLGRSLFQVKRKLKTRTGQIYYWHSKIFLDLPALGHPEKNEESSSTLKSFRLDDTVASLANRLDEGGEDYVELHTPSGLGQ